MKTKKSTSVKVILYKSKVLANGEHPLMLRVSKNGKRNYLSLGISCKPKLWNFEKQEPKSEHPNKELIKKIISDKIAEYNTELLNLKIENKDCTSETLIEKVEKPVRNITVFQYFDEKIEIMKKTFKIGNSKTYIEAKRALSNFRNGKDLVFSDIDYRFLMRYKEHFQERKLADTSISVFLRTLRALYNSAIKENVARIENYPFDEFKISELNTDTKKRALSKSDLDKIKNLELPTGTILHESKLYFLFSYYCQGINFNDIAKLQNKNIIDDRIEYVRTKTGKEIGFKILEPAKDIINYFRQVTGTNDNDYIFTILNKRKHITPVQIDNRINKVLKQVNLSLKEIGKLAGISTLLTTYVSRHTFATVLKKSGVSTDIISESLGHKSQKVTQIYLNSFENTTIDKAMENLL